MANKETFQSIRGKGLLIYEYIRGSHAYGLQKPDGSSDVDTAGVFIEPAEWITGLGTDYQEQIMDERGDTVWYSLKKFMNMLLSSNPTVLESLFIPDSCVLYEHPIMAEIKSQRDMFITKACFKPFLGYGYEQIKKARSLNKMIVNPVYERLEPLDFCYTFYKQGSSNIKNWLEYRGLSQKYCGLVNIPNMHGVYGCYYDWGNFFLNENISLEDVLCLTDEFPQYNEEMLTKAIQKWKDETDIKTKDLLYSEIKHCQRLNMVSFISEKYKLGNKYDIVWLKAQIEHWYKHQKPIGYKGIVGDDKKSTEIRLSSVSKGEEPICWLSYNENGYTKHCIDYKNYKNWEQDRNPERYKENVGKQFDRKNITHAVRLLHMGLEIAKGDGFNVDRTNIDRDFIMNIRLGNSTYDEIISYLESKKCEMEEAMKNSNLPENIDVDFVNNMLINIRKKQLNLA